MSKGDAAKIRRKATAAVPDELKQRPLGQGVPIPPIPPEPPSPMPWKSVRGGMYFYVRDANNKDVAACGREADADYIVRCVENELERIGEMPI